MKNFLPIPSGWRDIEKRPIPTHAELTKRVAVLMEHVCRHDLRIQRLGERVARQEKTSGDPPVNETGNCNSFLDPNLGRPWQESDDFTPDGRGYLIPRAVVMHLTEEDLAALEHLKTESGVVQPLQPGEVIAPIPTPVSERPWEREGWCNALGKCWWQPPASPGHWHLVEPGQWLRTGWLLPHYAFPVIPVAEGGRE